MEPETRHSVGLGGDQRHSPPVEAADRRGCGISPPPPAIKFRSSPSPPNPMFPVLGPHPPFFKSPFESVMAGTAGGSSTGLAGQLPLINPAEHLRLQQHLYTLAFADRMRMLQQGHHSHPTPPAGFPPFPPLLPAPRFCPPPDLAMFPLAKLDPRLFRVPFPEEPKPQHSYIGLIAMAILSSSEKKLVLADIYQYILDNFPYFRYRGPGWRNSIRHNLSLNDCFIKAGRAANGKGHFWAVHPACQDDFQMGDFSRRKAQRKVRRHMGLHLDDEEEEDTPPVSPPATSSALFFPLFAADGHRGLKLEEDSESSKEPSVSLPLPPALMGGHTVNLARNNSSGNGSQTRKPFSFGIDCILGKKSENVDNDDQDVDDESSCPREDDEKDFDDDDFRENNNKSSIIHDASSENYNIIKQQ